MLPSGNVVTNVYNGDNQRVSRTDQSGAVRFLWDRLAVLAETDGSNTTQAEYTREPGGFGPLVSQRRLTSGIWTPSYYHYDRLGSTRALTNASATVTDAYFYSAFGQPLLVVGSTVNPFQFVGHAGLLSRPQRPLLCDQPLARPGHRQMDQQGPDRAIGPM